MKVILVNRDVGTSIGNMPLAVCGKSGRNYGVAFVDVDRGGPVFEMTLEQYDLHKFDLIGNVGFRQQWIPCFEEKVELATVPLGPNDVYCAQPECGQLFTKKARNQLYCSERCRRKADKQKRHAVTAS